MRIHIAVTLITVCVLVSCAFGGRRDGRDSSPSGRRIAAGGKGRGGSLVKREKESQSWWSDSVPCYKIDRRGDQKLQRCTPPTTNAAIGKPVVATSTCGQGGRATLLCPQNRDCEVCDSNHRDRMHPAEYTVDAVRKDETCWHSKTHPPLRFGMKSSDQQTNVTITLGKKYTALGVSINFCSRVPDSFALFKSSNYGETWTPLEYYSSECGKMYGLVENSIIRSSNQRLAVCRPHDATSMISRPHTTKQHLEKVFNFLAGRPGSSKYESSEILQDWTAVTHIRVVLDRLQSPIERPASQNHNYFGISDIQVRGRCHCNGHASSCDENENGQTVCKCEHNTVGRDCDRCKAFHYDRPWAAATPNDAHTCVACNCNSHSTECRFSSSLYMRSGLMSGGVCINCKHHTDGQHCHECQQGYYRDQTKPIQDKRACIPCKCHPSGSISPDTCDQTNGQCMCKNGVTGLHCDLCMEGYQPSLLAHIPCEINRLGSIREVTRQVPFNFSIPEVVARMKDEYKSGCGTCRQDNKRRELKIQYYCNSTYVLKAKVIKKEGIRGNYKRFTINVYNLLKNVRRSSVNRITRAGVQYMYVRSNDLACKCPKIRVGKTYLLMGQDTYEQPDGITLSRDATAKRFKRSMEKKFKVYLTAQAQGICESNFNLY